MVLMICTLDKPLPNERQGFDLSLQLLDCLP